MEKNKNELLIAENEVMAASQHMLRGDNHNSEKLFLNAIERFERNQAKDIFYALSLTGLGQIYLAQNKLSEAKCKLEESLEIYQKKFPDEKIQIFLALNNISDVYEQEGDLVKSERVLKHAFTLVPNFYCEAFKDLIDVVSENYERILSKLGKFSEIVKFRKEVLQVLMKNSN